MIFPTQNKPGKKQGSYLLAMVFGLICILGVVSVITPSPVPETTAEQATETESIGSTRTVNYTAYYIRVMAIMVVSIAILIVSVRFYKRYVKVNDQSNLDLKILGRKYINSKQYFLKVFVDNKLLLVGVSEQSMNLIADLSESIEVVEGPEPESTTGENFGKHLDIRDQEA